VPDAVPRPERLSKYGNPESYEVMGQRYFPLRTAYGFVERGIASWYGPDFHGKRTSSGERYDMYQMTAAHKTLPIPCYVEVVNLQNGRRAVLKVNDRGPFKDNRVIDLSYVAARKLGIWQKGTGLVEVRVIDPAHPIVPNVATGPTPAVRPSRAPGEDEMAPAIVAAAGSPQESTAVARDAESAIAAAPSAHADVAGASAGGFGTTPPFFLQVGAFAEFGNAERLRTRLLASLRDVHVSPADSNGQAVYRVRVGPFTDVMASDLVVQKLQQLGIDQHRVVTD
jgi:rare lipoprotein A